MLTLYFSIYICFILYTLAYSLLFRTCIRSCLRIAEAYKKLKDYYRESGLERERLVSLTPATDRAISQLISLGLFASDYHQ